MKQLDYSSLDRPLTQAEIQPHMKNFGALVKGVIVVSILLIGLCVITYEVQLYVFTSLVIIVGLALIASMYISGKTNAKLARFAAMNGLGYRRSVGDPNYKGALFNVGHSRSLDRALMVRDKTLSYEIGEYQYTVGNGRSSRTYYVNYVRIALSRNLPHILLDGKKNNILGISTLPVMIDRDQKLSLEGGFDTHFTLYAPQKYETDVLYIFTPDVMATFMDCGEAIDAEIIDNELYLYTLKRLALVKPKNIEMFVRLAEVIGSRVEHQADYYMDETVNNRSLDIVANPGKRLSMMNFGTLSFIGGVLAVVVFGVVFLGNVLSVALQDGFSWQVLFMIIVGVGVVAGIIKIMWPKHR